MGRSKTLLLFISTVIVMGCEQQKSTFEKAQDMQCATQQELSINQTTLREMKENYCTQALSDLAPKAPEGVQPQWTRENPYPDLPDYFLYPDTNPMQLNGKRLQSIAMCMHKKCINMDQDPMRYCSVKGCKDNKGAFVLNTFLQLAKSCTAEPRCCCC